MHVKTALRPSLHWLRGCQGAVLSNRARKLCRQTLLPLQMLPPLRTMLLSQAALLRRMLREVFSSRAPQLLRRTSSLLQVLLHLQIRMLVQSTLLLLS